MFVCANVCLGRATLTFTGAVLTSFWGSRLQLGTVFGAGTVVILGASIFRDKVGRTGATVISSNFSTSLRTTDVEP